MSIDEIKKRVTILMRAEDHLFDSSHGKLCLPIIERVHKKMLINVHFSAIKVNDRLIIDGHHRYISSLLASYKLESVACPRPSAKEQVGWESVVLDDEDWEKPSDVLRYNKLAAKYLGISLDELLERIK